MNTLEKTRARKNLVSLLLVVICMCMIGTMKTTANADTYNGYYVDEWSDGGSRKYYTVYQHSYEKMGTPDFYRDDVDIFLNRQTGSDMKITFYRGYENPSVEQAIAFHKYLLKHSTARYSYAGYNYYTDDDTNTIEYMYAYLIEGWDFTDTNPDYQRMWDRNPWDNGHGTRLTLEYLGYGKLSDENWNYAWEQGNSFWLMPQTNLDYFGGIAIGFRFTEGKDDTVVRRYCRNETWLDEEDLTSADSLLPANVTFTTHLDVNNTEGFVRGVTQENGVKVSKAALRSDEYYAPAMVIWNNGKNTVTVSVQCMLEGNNFTWKDITIQPGSNIAFRTLASELKNASGSHEASWYYDGRLLCTYTWKVI